MKNKHCHYTSSRIRQYTLSCIKKCLLSLYIFLYNDNKHFNYTSSRIRRYHFHVLKNVCCHYTSSRIRRYTFSCIREMFVVII